MIGCAEQEKLDEVYIEGAGKCLAWREVSFSFFLPRSVAFLEGALADV